MKLSWLLFFGLLVGVVITGCKKDGFTETFRPDTPAIIPDFSSRVNASVSGFITDDNNNALAGATVTAGAVAVTTDQFGYFSCSSVDFPKTVGFVKVSKIGFFNGFRSFVPIAGKQTFIRLKLLPLTTTGTIEAAGGGTASTSGGLRVSLPANAVQYAASGNAYGGLISVAARWLNPADQAETALTMPGDLRGIDAEGYLKQLVSFGMVAVELTSETGELLQLVSGKKATLQFPIPASLLSTAPSTIALWSFYEARGLWKEEATATKQGDVYIGEVGHFSYWNCDIGLPLVNFSAQLLDTALQPLTNVAVSIGIVNQPNSARMAYTDANGEVYGMVPANSNLAMEAVAACNERITFKNFTTTTTAATLGSLVVNLGTYGARISGNVTGCGGNAVTDGYVVITTFGSNSFLPLQNGVFTASGTICNGAVASITAVDRVTGLQSPLTERALQPGVNALGTFTTCTTPTTESINITKDGLLTTYTLSQHIFGGNYSFALDSTQLNAVDLLNGNQTVFDIGFTGGTTGVFPLTNNRFVFGGVTYQFVSAASVTISNYGLIGEFISGNFSGTAADVVTPTDTHTFSISFNIKRDQ